MPSSFHNPSSTLAYLCALQWYILSGVKPNSTIHNHATHSTKGDRLMVVLTQAPTRQAPRHGFHLEGHVTFPNLEMSMSSLMFMGKAHPMAHLLASLLTIPFGVSYSSNCESSLVICFCVLSTRGILSFGSTSSHLSFSPCDLLPVGVHLKSNLATLITLQNKGYKCINK